MASSNCAGLTCGRVDFCARRGILVGEMFLLREGWRFVLILAVVVLLSGLVAILLGAVRELVG